MVVMTASFIFTSTPPSHSRISEFCSPSIPTQSKRRVMYSVKCLQGPSTENTKEETETESESESFISTLSQSSISTYNLCAGIGAVGFLETGYLTYLKVTGAEAFCPIGGGSCTDILNSDYAAVFGVPLPLIGMTAYGLVSSLGLLLSRRNFPSGLGEANGRLILLGITTSMATASGYFLYLLITKFTGASCSYCFLSVALSFTLLIAMLKDLGWQEIKNVVGLQILVAGLVVAALNTSYSTSQPVAISIGDVYLPFYETIIEKPSSPLALSLAKHLRSVGAKMYGAFWCSHCLEQKQMFGYEAAKILDYVECFPEGVFKGTKMDKACSAVGIEGFPTWVINGQVLSGEKDFTELAKISGFNHEDVEPS